MVKYIDSVLYGSLIILFSVYFYNFAINYGQSGHDTFQYIQFSTKVFTDEPYIRHYRVGLYFIINLVNSIIGWEPYSLTIIITFFFIVANIYFYLLSRNFIKSELLIFLCYLIFIFNINFFNSVKENELTVIETACILGFLYHFYLLYKNKYSINLYYKLINFFLAGFFAYLGTHVHEDKSIFYIFFIFIYFFYQKKSAINIFLVYFILSLITASYFGIFDVFNNLLTAHKSVSDDYGSKSDLILNFYIVIKDSFYFFVGKIYFEFFILFFLIKSFFIKKLKLNFLNIYFLASVVYFIFLVTAYGKISLTRVYAPVSVIFVIIFFNAVEKFYYEISNILRNMLVILIIIPIADKIGNFNEIIKPINASKYLNVYNYIMSVRDNSQKYNIKIMELPSFEKRYGMWGGYHAYGLSSKVYFGENSKNLNSYMQTKYNDVKYKIKEEDIKEILNNFDYIVISNKNKISINESLIINKLKENKFNFVKVGSHSIVRIK